MPSREPCKLYATVGSLLLHSIFVATLIAALPGCSHIRGAGAFRDEQPLSAYIDNLHLDAERCWSSGQHSQALLYLEHACALVATFDITEEGGIDYTIKTRVMDLWQMGRIDVLKTALKNSAYYPQTCGWIWGGAGEIGSEHEVVVLSNRDYLWQIERQAASLHIELGAALEKQQQAMEHGEKCRSGGDHESFVPASDSAAIQAPRQLSTENAFEVFRGHLAAKRYHEAFLLLDQVNMEFQGVGENAAGFELSNAISAAAANGQHDWGEILADPSITLKYKLALTEEIHAHVIH